MKAHERGLVISGVPRRDGMGYASIYVQKTHAERVAQQKALPAPAQGQIRRRETAGDGNALHGALGGRGFGIGGDQTGACGSEAGSEHVSEWLEDAAAAATG